jgi:AraC-like DNA-binding protein
MLSYTILCNMRIGERQPKNLKQEILSAAVQMFAKEGYQHVSMRKLAVRIGYSPSTIYLYFKDRAELFECVCEHTFAQLAAICGELVFQCGDPLEALRKCCRAYVDFGLEHPDQYTAAFLLDSGRRLQPDEVAVRFPMAMISFKQLLSGVEACMHSGAFAQSDPKAVSQVIWAGLHGITALLIVKASFPWIQRDHLIDLVIESMLKSFRSCGEQAVNAASANLVSGLPLSLTGHPGLPEIHTTGSSSRRGGEVPTFPPNVPTEPRLDEALRIATSTPQYDVKALARSVNLSPSRLQHLFREQLGISLRDLMLGLRLRKAEHLLTSTNMSIKEISFEVGYNHPSSFVRAFRNRCLETPESYRTAAQKANH